MLRSAFKSSAFSPSVLFRNFTCSTVARDARPTPSQSSSKPPPYLNIKLPDLSAPLPETDVHIPFTPDFWESSRAKPAPALSEEPQVPKVIVVAGDSARADSMHISAAIREHVTVEHDPAEQASVPKASNMRSLFLDVADDLMLPKDLGAFKYGKGRLHGDLYEETLTSTETGISKSHHRTLDNDQVKGIWVIGGLLAGSWLAGGLLKKDTKYTESE